MEFLSFSLGFVAIVMVVWLLLIIALGNYGRDTELGYWGCILLALFTTPVIAFIVILVLKSKRNGPSF